MKIKLLYIEDEVDLGNVTRQYLEFMDFEVRWCTTAEAALAVYRKAPDYFDLIILDIQLPDMDGFDLAEQMLHNNEDACFLFLTARKEKSDRIKGLKIGAIDYITKPFDVDELVLRIQNIVRHHGNGSANRNPDEQPAVLSIGDICLNKGLLTLILVDGGSISLTQREAVLLEYLYLNRNTIIQRTDILTQIWGENNYFLGRSLDVFISRLRKILQNSSRVKIDNVYGIGFIFTVKS